MQQVPTNIYEMKSRIFGTVKDALTEGRTRLKEGLRQGVLISTLAATVSGRRQTLLIVRTCAMFEGLVQPCSAARQGLQELDAAQSLHLNYRCFDVL